MSKKDKLKFRKRIKAQILQEMAQAQKDMPRSTPAPSIIAKLISSPKIEANLKMPEPDTKITPGVSLPVSSLGDTIGLVRQDLKKSAIIIGSIIIVIVVLYLIDQKTGIVLKAGNELFQLLHIGV